MVPEYTLQVGGTLYLGQAETLINALLESGAWLESSAAEPEIDVEDPNEAAREIMKMLTEASLQREPFQLDFTSSSGEGHSDKLWSTINNLMGQLAHELPHLCTCAVYGMRYDSNLDEYMGGDVEIHRPGQVGSDTAEYFEGPSGERWSHLHVPSGLDLQDPASGAKLLALAVKDRAVLDFKCEAIVLTTEPAGELVSAPPG